MPYSTIDINLAILAGDDDFKWVVDFLTKRAEVSVYTSFIMDFKLIITNRKERNPAIKMKACMRHL
jgi:hypothetical protein